MPRGRHSEYSPVILPAVKAAAFFGATHEEIAEYIGISIRSLYQWKLENPELAQALKRGQEKSVERVADSLYRLALAGNVTAQIFFLKNRAPQDWRDVQHLDQAVGVYIVADRPMSEEQWIAERATVDARRQPRQIDVTPSVTPAESGSENVSSSNGLADTDM